MVAYSFKKQFAPGILDGTKRQTIRADRTRHARPGDKLQLFTGMRTKQCKLIARAECIAVQRVLIAFDSEDRPEMDGVGVDGISIDGLDQFAIEDGFGSWSEMRAFWRANHPGIDEFDGVLVRWGELHA